MSKRFTDAEFEVVTGPRFLPRPHFDARKMLGQFLVGLLVLAAGFTLVMGLAGADLDTRDNVAPSSVVSVDQPLMIPAVEPAPTSATHARR